MPCFCADTPRLHSYGLGAARKLRYWYSICRAKPRSMDVSGNSGVEAFSRSSDSRSFAARLFKRRLYQLRDEVVPLVLDLITISIR